MKFPGFVGGSNETFATIGDCQRTINLYPTIVGAAGKSTVALAGTPGLTSLFTVAEKASVRGMFLGDLQDTAFFYAAIDDRLYKVKLDGTSSLDIGGLSSDNKPIKWATGGSGRDTLVIANGTAYSVKAGVLAAIVDLAGVTVTACASTNNFWLIGLANGQWQISALNDVDSWDPLDFEVADDSSQPVRGIQTSNGQVWLHGATRSNVWYYSGSSLFPFEQMKSALIRYGLLAPDSTAIVDNAMVWLAAMPEGQAQVVAARTYSPERISTPAIESAIAAISTKADAVGYGIESRGHSFYVLTFPAAGATFVYDFATKQWHERLYWTGAAWQAHLGKCHLAVGDVHLVGSRSAGIIYTLSDTVYTDAGAAIRRLRRAPHISNENRRLRFASAELDLEKGQASAASNPLMYLRWSNDGGNTYGTALQSRIGESGEYGVRVRWSRLGAGRDRVYEVYSDAAIKHFWTDMYINLSAS